MTTDWELIRETMNEAIDACEKLDALNPSENERSEARYNKRLDGSAGETM